MRIRFPIRYTIIFVAIQYIFPQLTDLLLRVSIQTQRRESQLENRATVCRKKKKHVTSKRTILSGNCTREGKAQRRTISLVLLRLPKSMTKELESNNRHYSAVNIFGSFVGNAKPVLYKESTSRHFCHPLQNSNCYTSSSFSVAEISAGIRFLVRLDPVLEC